MNNMPEVKVGIVAVSRDCFPESLSVNRRKALVDAYTKKYDAKDIYECPVCIVESEIHMVQALEDIKKARSVSEISGPKFPRYTQSALHPAFLISSRAWTIWISLSTIQTGHS